MTQEPPTISRASALRPVPASLRVVHPAGLSWRLAFENARVILGRDPGEGSPRLRHSTVSRKHFAVQWSADHGAHVGFDLDSHNGTRVDGVAAPVQQPVVLRDGAIVQLGDVFLAYQLELAVAEPAEISRDDVAGDAASMRAVRAAIARAAADPSPVILLGEPGTGKKAIARELHRLSGRSGPLIASHCATLSPQGVESQLFGHVRGAFSGATTDHDGLFRAAHRGTLFLDEVGEIPLALQPKLLRALHEGQVQPVGASGAVAVDVRVVAATSRDLAAAAALTGGFHRDLYARLSHAEIRIPALRERRGDLLSWLDRLHRIWCTSRGSDYVALPLSADAAEVVLLHDWPDNLRGLDRLVHELASLGKHGELAVGDLPVWLPRRAARPEPRTGAREPRDSAPAATSAAATSRRAAPTLPPPRSIAIPPIPPPRTRKGTE